ncbi:MAG: DNA/RNA non-specific endonuclease [Microscillaceae bacterium]|nr:DNA/RNA non-specific endonuclease [Microscillaceae bacterium]MDW8460022.1 DNA/RNA non-specific endonuclease [Cytophagales bacterium]
MFSLKPNLFGMSIVAILIVVVAFFYFNRKSEEYEPVPSKDSSNTLQEPIFKKKEQKEYKQGKVQEEGLEIPEFSSDEIIVRHTHYTLCYSEEHEQAKWVAYQLDARELQKEAERGNDFRPDPAVPTGSSLPEDYRGSGYDRGHLAPAGDFAFSQEAMSETFYMSNMSPQVPELNREGWRILEETIREWAKRDKSLLIVTGPVLKGKMKKIGKRNKVSVPPAYYKVVVDITEPEKKGIGFIMPNAVITKPIHEYALTIAEVEKETGINFFPKLADSLERELENYNQWSTWFKKVNRRSKR